MALPSISEDTTIYSIPNEVLEFYVLPNLRVENPLRLNQQIKEEAQNFLALGSQCSFLYQLVQKYLANLKTEYHDNVAAGAAAREDARMGFFLPLHACIVCDNKTNFLALLRAGEDVNAQDRSGKSPLHMAVLRRDKRFVEILLSHPEVKPDLMTRRGKNTPLQLAKVDEIRALLQNAVSKTAEKTQEQA